MEEDKKTKDIKDYKQHILPLILLVILLVILAISIYNYQLVKQLPDKASTNSTNYTDDIIKNETDIIKNETEIIENETEIINETNINKTTQLLNITNETIE